MRRIMMLVAVGAMTAMLLGLMAAPALAAAREPTSFNGPGNASDVIPTIDNKAVAAQPAGQNCYGVLSSGHVAGPGGDPGSLAVPTQFPQGTPNYTGHAVSTLPPGDISGIQRDFANQYAGTSC